MTINPGEHDKATGLTLFQVEVARLFFGLPASEGFLLAGGAALLAQHLTHRPTQDLDFFTHRGAGDVATARDSFEDAIGARGWEVEHIQDGPTFCRMVVHGPEDLLVDLALDSPPGQPPTASFIGPTFAPTELAGRKLLALFDRAEARDFADVFALAERYGKHLLLSTAVALDAGFDDRYLAQQLRTLDRFQDSEIPLDPELVPGLRAYFAAWRKELID